MTQTTFTFDTGYDGSSVADGTTATTTNTGAQQVMNAVFSADAAVRGPFGLRMTTALGEYSALRLQPGGGSGAATSDSMAYLFRVSMHSWAGTRSGYVPFAILRHSGGIIGALRWLADGSVILVDNPGVTVTAVLPAGSDAAVPMWWSIVVNNSTGAYSVKVFTAPGVLVTEKSGTHAWPTQPMGPIQFGAPSQPGYGVTMDVDHVVIGLGESAHITVPAEVGPPLPAPVVTVVPTNTTAIGASDGQAVATWTGAGTFESCILPGNVTTGAVSTRSSTATDRTFGGLAAGTYTVAVRRTV